MNIDKLKNMMKDVSFTDDEKEAIERYQSPGNDGISGDVNSALYDEKQFIHPELKKYIYILTNACDKNILNSEIEVIRGEYDYYGLLTSKNDDEWIGRVLEKKGFLSTSITNPFSRPITFIIKVPEGTHAIYIGDFAKCKISGEFEDELLIQRGYKFQIDHIERDENRYPTVYGHLIIN